MDESEMLREVLEAYKDAHRRLAGTCHPFCTDDCPHVLREVEHLEEQLEKFGKMP